MKRFGLIFFVIVSTFSVHSQDAFFVYRNDGQFNAFLYHDVDSVVYSNYDTEWNYHQDVVTQEVWTADSLYRIPIAAIDSVGFVKPETVYKENVHNMSNIMTYITSVDGMIIELSPSIPTSLIPRKGDVLLFESNNEHFPYGFAGKVLEISIMDKVRVTCEQAGMDEVYDYLVECIEINTVEDSVSNTRAQENRSFTIIPRTRIPISWEVPGVSVGGDVWVNLRGRFVREICPGKPIFADLTLIFDIESEAEAKLNGKIGREWELIEKGCPIAALPMGFYVTARLTPFMATEISGSLSHHFETHTVQTIGARLQNRKLDLYRNSIQDLQEKNREVNASISFFCGVKGEVAVHSPADLIRMAATLSAGPYLEGKIALSNSDANSWYELEKDDYLSRSVKVEGDFSAGAYLADLKVESKLGPWSYQFLERKNYAFPLFTKPEYSTGNQNTDARFQTDITRDLINPVQVGLGLYDASGKRIDVQYCAEKYQYYNDFHSRPINVTFSDLEQGASYTCYPMVRYGTSEYRATPSTTIETRGCPAHITMVECTGASYNKNEEYPNILEYSVSAQLDRTDGIAEWGLYFMDKNKSMTEYAFSSVSSQQTMELTQQFKDNQLLLDFNRFVAEYKGQVGVYVKYTNQKGEMKSVYSDIKDFTLRYDTKPSIKMSNPFIAYSTLKETYTETDDEGNTVSYNTYETQTAYDIEVKGGFWMDYVYYGVSAGHSIDGGWSVEGDFSSQFSMTCSYPEGGGTHSHWFIIQLRNNSNQLTSNFLNLSGEEMITNAWVTSNQVYATRSANNEGKSSKHRCIGFSQGKMNDGIAN